MIQLLMPMSGQGKRFTAAGYPEPKPLVAVGGEPMVARLLATLPERWPTTFVMAENHRATRLPETLRVLRKAARQIFIPSHARGPGQAIRAALRELDPDAPVLVSYCDYGMGWDPAAFERFVVDTGCDACVIAYRGFHAHYLEPQMYAYCRMAGERVVEVREKACFTADRETEFASSGGYYFRTARLLAEALDHQEAIGLELGGELYTSLTVEALLRKNPAAHVRAFEIPIFYQWGTPSDVETYDFWHQTFAGYNRLVTAHTPVAQLLMPLAGQGSRFHGLSPLPKPLIPVAGKPMFRAALESMPPAERVALVALASHADHIRTAMPARAELVTVAKTPPGQALTTEIGLRTLAAEKEVLVTACDHGIVLAPEIWNEVRSGGYDAAIFTVTGYPGARRRPAAFAYVVPVPNSVPGRVTQVAHVSVKAAVSADPAAAALLVGTFWFRTAALAVEAIEALKAMDLRVNGELYLDSVFAPMIAAGRRVAMAPLAGYMNWGDPEAYAEASYWHEAFCSTRPRRRRGSFE